MDFYMPGWRDWEWTLGTRVRLLVTVTDDFSVKKDNRTCRLTPIYRSASHAPRAMRILRTWNSVFETVRLSASFEKSIKFHSF